MTGIAAISWIVRGESLKADRCALSFGLRLKRRPQMYRSHSCSGVGASERVLNTDPPIIVEMSELIRGKKDVLSLAQGIVHWSPPNSATESAKKIMDSPSVHSYGAGEGSTILIEALRKKLREENGLNDSEIMVTAGANQAYVNCVLALADGGKSSIQALFLPYYFNHKMAIQMTDGIPLLLPSDAHTLLPDLEVLETTLKAQRITTVTLVNPGNPTGTMIPQDILKAVAALTKRYNAWLIIDNTYEYFAWNPAFVPHACIEDDHVINIFSMSKAFGCPGWRIGYIAYPRQLRPQFQKIQDTILITPPQLSQAFAIGALKEGKPWVQSKLTTLQEPRRLIAQAVQRALGGNELENDFLRGGDGAIYYLFSLPENLQDDYALTRQLVHDHSIAIIPGSACGAPGTIRVCYANLAGEPLTEAINRLETGLTAARRNNKSMR